MMEGDGRDSPVTSGAAMAAARQWRRRQQEEEKMHPPDDHDNYGNGRGGDVGGIRRRGRNNPNQQDSVQDEDMPQVYPVLQPFGVENTIFSPAFGDDHNDQRRSSIFWKAPPKVKAKHSKDFDDTLFASVRGFIMLLRQHVGRELLAILMSIMIAVSGIALLADYSGRESINDSVEHLMAAHISAMAGDFEFLIRPAVLANEFSVKGVSAVRGEAQVDLSENSTVYDVSFAVRVNEEEGIQHMLVESTTGALIGASQLREGDNQTVLFAKGVGNRLDCYEEYGYNESTLTRDLNDLRYRNCSRDERDRPWYQQVMRTKKPVFNVSREQFPNGEWRDVLVFALPVGFDEDTQEPLSETNEFFGNFTGVAAAYLDHEYLQAALDKVFSQRSQYITDRTGVMIVLSNLDIFMSTSHSGLTPTNYAELDPTTTEARGISKILEVFGSIPGVPHVSNFFEAFSWLYSGAPFDHDSVVVALSRTRQPYQEAGVDCLVVSTSEKASFSDKLDDAQVLSVFIGFLAMVAVLVLFQYFWAMTRRRTMHQTSLKYGSDKFNEYRALVWGIPKRDSKADWTFFVFALTVLLTALATFMYWGKVTASVIEDVSEAVVVETRVGTDHYLDDFVITSEHALRYLQAENARKGYLSRFEENPVCDQSSPFTEATVPLMRLMADTLDSMVAADFDVPYIVAGFENGLTVFTRNPTGENASYVIVADNTTGVNGLTKLARYYFDDDGLPNRELGDYVSSVEHWDVNMSDFFATADELPLLEEGELGRMKASELHPLLRFHAEDQSLPGIVIASRAYGWDTSSERLVPGVIAVGVAINLQDSQYFLSDLGSFGLASELFVYVTEASRDIKGTNDTFLLEELVSAVTGNLIDEGCGGDTEGATGNVIFANESSDSFVSVSATEVNYRVGNDSNIPVSLRYFPDGLNTSRIDFVHILYGAQLSWYDSMTYLEPKHNVRWIVSVVLKTDTFFQSFHEWSAFSILLVLMGLVAIMYAISSFRRVRDRTERRMKLEQAHPPRPAVISKVYQHIDTMRDHIKVAGPGKAGKEKKLRREQIAILLWRLVADAQDGLELLGIKENTPDRARRYIIDAYDYNDRRVMATMHNEASGMGSLLPEDMRDSTGVPIIVKRICSKRHVYYLYSSFYYRMLIFGTLICHMGVSLWEAPAFDDDHPEYYDQYGTTMLTFNGLFTAIEIFDLFLGLWVKTIYKSRDPLMLLPNAPADGKRARRVSKMMVTRMILTFLLALDWVYLASTEYVIDLEGPDGEDPSRYQRTLIPFSCPLRGILLIVRHEALQAALAVFFVTIVQAREIILLGFSFLTMGVCFGIALLPGQYDKDALGRNFDDYRSAYIAMFTLIFTGENYPEVLYPTFESGRFFRVFFIVFAFIGTFLVVALIIGSFQSTYKTQMRKLMSKNNDEQMLAILTAYIILKQEQSPKSSPSSGDIFMLHDEKHIEFIDECGASLESRPWGVKALEHGKTTISLSEFVGTMQQLIKLGVLRFDRVSQQLREERKAWLSETRQRDIELRRIPTTEVAPPPLSASAATSSLPQQQQQEQQQQLGGGKPGSSVSRGWRNIRRSVTNAAGHLGFNVRAAEADINPDANNSRPQPRGRPGTRQRRASWDESTDPAALGVDDVAVDGVGPGPDADGSGSAERVHASRNPAFDGHVFGGARGADARRAPRRLSDRSDITEDSDGTVPYGAAGGGGGESHQLASVWSYTVYSVRRLRKSGKAVKRHPAYDNVVRVLVLFNVWLVLLLGTKKADTAFVRILCQIMLFIFLAETLFRLFTSGWRAYLFKDHPSDPFRKPAHRWDFAVSVATLFFYLFLMGTGKYKASGSNEAGYWADFMFAIPTLRLITVVNTNKNIFFGLFTILRGVFPLAAILIIAIWCYAVIGVYLFSGLFDFMPADVYDTPEANFNSVTEAVSTLFQIMLGESWNGIMEATMDTGFGFTTTLYFLSYVVVVSVLFSPMFIGLVCDAYLVLWASLAQAQKEEEAARIARKLNQQEEMIAAKTRAVFGKDRAASSRSLAFSDGEPGENDMDEDDDEDNGEDYDQYVVKVPPRKKDGAAGTVGPAADGGVEVSDDVASDDDDINTHFNQANAAAAASPTGQEVEVRQPRSSHERREMI